MLHPEDRLELDETAWPQAELNSTYAQIDHLTSLVDALYAGVCGLVDALTPVPELPGLSPVAVEHLRLALKHAREALQMAEDAL